MKIGIVIPVINLWVRYTKTCLDSIKTKYDTRIVLVDNASTDETREEAPKLVNDSFIHRRNEENIGASASWNWGIRDCFDKGCDYVLVLNNDILLHPNAINRLVERFERKDEDVVVVTCMNVRGQVPFAPMVTGLDDKEKEFVPEAESPDFSAFMVNKKCWDEVGEFDEGFSPAYYEDNDFHYRVKLAGLKAIVYPPALYYHYGSKTQNEALAKPIVDSGRTGAYFVAKWGGPPGKEQWKHPFNREELSWKKTKQSG